ncbi:hypothetical protein Tco_0691700, partial [Tanacetum coccineum]
MKVEESLNVTFDESPPPTKLSPLVDDDVGEKEAIENNIKVVNNNNIEDDSVDVEQLLDRGDLNAANNSANCCIQETEFSAKNPPGFTPKEDSANNSANCGTAKVENNMETNKDADTNEFCV